MFNKLDGTAKTSIDNLIGTLKRQVEYMETYVENIQRAMEMGVDEGLVRKLSDGSEESAQILAAIVQGGEEDIVGLSYGGGNGNGFFRTDERNRPGHGGYNR